VKDDHERQLVNDLLTVAGFCTLRSADRCCDNWVHLNMTRGVWELGYRLAELDQLARICQPVEAES
jgi:hypothetical protein